MRKLSAITFVVIAVVLASSTAPLFGWSERGHAIIGRIAERHLTPYADAVITDLLEGRSLAGIASWADEIRMKRGDTESWHFVNIPAGASGYSATRDCPNGSCIVEV